MNNKQGGRKILWAGLSLGLCQAGWAVAQANVQEVAEVAAAAQGVQENPDCVADAVAGQAMAEGVRRIGAASGKLLGKIGVKAPAAAPARSAAVANPCNPTTAPAAGRAPQAPAPVVAPSRPRFSATRPASGQGGRNCGALGTGCADGMKPLVACIEEKDGYLWKVLADAVEEKRDRTPLSPQQRNEIDADIAALRAAHAAGAARVAPVDPARPDRYNSWLAPEEYSVAATHASQSINAHTEACNAKYARF
jgi:F0F1-type ATP synthase membrane subunit c/vacuolar-type H+-ATPase subunit K